MGPQLPQFRRAMTQTLPAFERVRPGIGTIDQILFGQPGRQRQGIVGVPIGL